MKTSNGRSGRRSGRPPPRRSAATFGAEPGLDRAGRRERAGHRRRVAARRPVRRRARTAPAGTCAGSRPAATSRPSSRTSARCEPATRCPACGDGVLQHRAGDRGWPHLQAGTRYSVPLNATYLDEAGKEHPIVMGCYGIGPARITASAVEQSHDEAGIIWPAYDRAVRRAHGGDRRPLDASSSRSPSASRPSSRERGVRCCSTTARPGPGAKFADAELIGCPGTGHGREADGDRGIGRRPGAPRARRRPTDRARRGGRSSEASFRRLR